MINVKCLKVRVTDTLVLEVSFVLFLLACYYFAHSTGIPSSFEIYWNHKPIDEENETAREDDHEVDFPAWEEARYRSFKIYCKSWVVWHPHVANV